MSIKLATESYCGFLLMKTTLSALKGWQLRWFELSGGRLWYYSSETIEEVGEGKDGGHGIEEEFLGSHMITSDSSVEVVQEKGHSFVMKLTVPDKYFPFVLAAPNMSALESWMLLIIQCQKGDIKPEEKFAGGDKEDIKSALACPLACNGFITSHDVDYFIHVEEGVFHDDSERMECVVMKRSIHGNKWRKRHIVLVHRVLTLYSSAEDARSGKNPRGTRSFDSNAKVALLPPGQEGQKYSLSLITSNAPFASKVSLRISFSDEDSLDVWYKILRVEIMRQVKLSDLKENSNLVCQPTCPRLYKKPSIRLFDLLKFKQTSQQKKSAEYYARYFLHRRPNDGCYEVVVYENQRYIPVAGWSSSHLFLTDYSKYSDIEGRSFPGVNLGDVSPPPNFRWDDGTEFTIDGNYTSTDADGWVYGKYFHRINLHLSENAPHSYQKHGDFVRRRRWSRKLIPLSQLS